MKNYNRVCCVDSDYCLFLYLLSSTREEIDNTYFFFSDGIPQPVITYFANQSFSFRIAGKNKFVVETQQIVLRFLKYLIWPFLRNADFYGMPFAGLSCEIIGNKPINLIEEGYEHMQLSIVFKIRFNRLRRFFHGINYNNFDFTRRKINSILLTRALPFSLPSHISLHVMSLEKSWHENKYSRNVILKSHGILSSDFVRLKECRYLLVTQTFTEDGVMNLEEEINLYKKLIQGIDETKLCVKMHPREKKSYDSIFPHSFIFGKRIPLQIFDLEGIRFERIFTICSSGISSFSNGAEVVIGGTCCHPGLRKKFGEIKGILNDD